MVVLRMLCGTMILVRCMHYSLLFRGVWNGAAPGSGHAALLLSPEADRLLVDLSPEERLRAWLAGCWECLRAGPASAQTDGDRSPPPLFCLWRAQGSLHVAGTVFCIVSMLRMFALG